VRASARSQKHAEDIEAHTLYLKGRFLWKWIKGGKIKAVNLPSGRYRIPESEIVRILQSAWAAGSDVVH